MSDEKLDPENQPGVGDSKEVWNDPYGFSTAEWWPVSFKRESMPSSWLPTSTGPILWAGRAENGS